jgi:Arc/MetJ-type ribon-helix-helix transcriptional regulator
MPRRKLADPPIEVHLSIPSSLLAQVDKHLIDPIRGKPKYGARSELIKSLLTQWLASKNMETL